MYTARFLLASNDVLVNDGLYAVLIYFIHKVRKFYSSIVEQITRV